MAEHNFTYNLSLGGDLKTGLESAEASARQLTTAANAAATALEKLNAVKNLNTSKINLNIAAGINSKAIIKEVSATINAAIAEVNTKFEAQAKKIKVHITATPVIQKDFASSIATLINAQLTKVNDQMSKGSKVKVPVKTTSLIDVPRYKDIILQHAKQALAEVAAQTKENPLKSTVHVLLNAKVKVNQLKTSVKDAVTNGFAKATKDPIKVPLVFAPQQTDAGSTPEVSQKKTLAHYDNLINKQGQLNKKAHEFRGIIQRWWDDFGRVAVGFTIAYRAMNAIGMGIMSVFERIKGGITESGELATLQSKLTLFADLSTNGAKNIGEVYKQMSIPVKALQKESINSLSSLEELSTGMDELAQGNVFVKPEQMKNFTNLVDFTLLVAKTTGNSARQLRSEFQALMQGDFRASNILGRYLRKSGIINKEDIEKIKHLKDQGEIFNKVLEKIGGSFEKIKRIMMEASPQLAYDKWTKTLQRAMTIGISDYSRSMNIDSENIFGKTIMTAVDSLTKKLADPEIRKNMMDFVEILNKILEAFLTLQQNVFIGVGKFATLINNTKGVLWPLLKMGLALEIGYIINKQFLKAGVALAAFRKEGYLCAVAISILNGRLAAAAIKIPGFAVAMGAASKAAVIFKAIMDSLIVRLGLIYLTCTYAISAWIVFARTMGILEESGTPILNFFTNIIELLKDCFNWIMKVTGALSIMERLSNAVDQVHNRKTVSQTANMYGVTGINAYKATNFYDAYRNAPLGGSEQKQIYESLKKLFGSKTDAFLRDASGATSGKNATFATDNIKTAIVDAFKEFYKVNKDVALGPFDLLKGFMDKMMSSDQILPPDLPNSPFEFTGAEGKPEDEKENALKNAAKKNIEATAKKYKDLLSEINGLIDKQTDFQNRFKTFFDKREYANANRQLEGARAEINAEIDALKKTNDKIQEQLTSSLTNKGITEAIAALEEQKSIVKNLTNARGGYSSEEATNKIEEINDLIETFKSGDIDLIRTKLSLTITDVNEKIIELTKNLEELKTATPFSYIKEKMDDWGKSYFSTEDYIVSTTQNMFTSLESSLVSFISEGKNAFRGFYQSLLTEFYTFIVRKLVIEKMYAVASAALQTASSAFSGGFAGWRQGGGDAGATIDRYSDSTLATSRHASGGIISEHVIGYGQSSGRRYEIGEAGYPEEVRPSYLKGSGGGDVSVNVYGAPEGTKVNQTTNSSGGKDIDIIIDEMVAKSLASGKGAKVLRSQYGVKRTLAGR